MKSQGEDADDGPGNNDRGETLRRMSLALLAYLAVAVTALIATARAGYGPDGLFWALAGVAAASGLCAGVRAWRTEAAARLHRIETDHMAVWASTVLVSVICLIVSLLTGPTADPLLLWLMTGLGVLGWVAVWARTQFLTARLGPETDSDK